MAFVSFKKTILRNLVSKPYTRKTEKQYPEGTRGHVENDMDVCVLHMLLRLIRQLKPGQSDQ